ncbi:MAG: MBL fold metallo-hydrolase [Deltaproteobacteria bacterium]|nr:MBL fold metallo-hydrolase [Deltaproteobacteria bacterium]
MSPQKLHDAASLVLVDGQGRVLVGTRAIRIPFLGGFMAFSGGRVDPADAGHAQRLFGREGMQDTLRATALRELFEEMGLVIDGPAARRAEGGFTEASFSLDPERLVPVGRWITPEYSPIRFDTRFFLLQVEQADLPFSHDGEMRDPEWADPRAVLRAHLAQAVLLPPPTQWALSQVAAGLEGVAARLVAHPGARGEEHLDFEPLAGIRALPLLSPTLPPATTTNAYLLGHEKLLVVDPAAYDADERDKLLCLLEARMDRGATLEAVVLTHHHGDHVGAAEWLRKKLHAPVWAHPLTRDLLVGKVGVDRTLSEGDVLDLGLDEAGVPFTWRVLHTPGHARGHIVLEDLRPGGRALVVGDMVAAIGSIIIDPDEGDMAEYLAQLARLRALPPRVLLPAHGPPIVDGYGKLDEYIAHRLMRERKVMDALVAVGEGRPEDLLPMAYDDTPAHLYPLAARACRAHLDKLVHEGRVTRIHERFKVTA